MTSPLELSDDDFRACDAASDPYGTIPAARELDARGGWRAGDEGESAALRAA